MIAFLREDAGSFTLRAIILTTCRTRVLLRNTLAKCEPSFGLEGRLQKSETRSLPVFWQSKLATCESVCFAVVNHLWANARTTRELCKEFGFGTW
jgi:hypothetical protein